MYTALAVLGAHTWAHWLHNPCLGWLTLAILRVLGDGTKSAYIKPAFLGAHMWLTLTSWDCPK